MNRRSFLAAIGLSPLAVVPTPTKATEPVTAPLAPDNHQVRQWAREVERAVLAAIEGRPVRQARV